MYTFGACGLIGVGIWGWNTYQEGPHAVYELGKIRLGMTPEEVRLRKGEPTDPLRKTPRSEVWIYGSTEVVFFRENGAAIGVSAISTWDDYIKVLTFGVGDSANKLIDKLGHWEYERTHKTTLWKLVSYPKFNVAYLLNREEIIRKVYVYDAEQRLFLELTETVN